MKPLILCLLGYSYSLFAFNFDAPEASLSFPNGYSTTVFYGESIKIPIQMDYKNLKQHKYWLFPPGTTLETTSGLCPFFANDEENYPLGSCNLNLIIPGTYLGKLFSGTVSYIVSGRERENGEDHSWNYAFNSPGFKVAVIPHYLTILDIPQQEASLQHRFNYNLKSAIDYYDENAEAGKKIQGVISPMAQDGLSFDAETFSIIGIPERTGSYAFKIAAKNANGTTKASDLIINVAEESKNTPQFKSDYQVPSAARSQKYSINLLELIEKKADLNLSNQISFRIDEIASNPGWLAIAKDNATRLEGEAPKQLAGTELAVTLIASSNTGGDSEPKTIQIPIALDPSQRPFMEFFKINQVANTYFSKDLAEYVQDPSQDGSLKILIDKIVPSAPWLHLSPDHPTILEGFIPSEAADKTYRMTVRANNLTGGSSIPIVAQLIIKP